MSWSRWLLASATCRGPLSPQTGLQSSGCPESHQSPLRPAHVQCRATRVKHTAYNRVHENIHGFYFTTRRPRNCHTPP